MGNMNLGRVILGGLLAGLVINVGESIVNMLVLGEQIQAAFTALNIEPPGGGAIAIYVVWGFALGILMVWLYAAIRPRLSLGPRTAAIAGAFTWILASFFPRLDYGLTGILPTDLLVIGGVWSLVEFVLAAEAGAWLYKEEGAPTAAGAADRAGAAGPTF